MNAALDDPWTIRQNGWMQTWNDRAYAVDRGLRACGFAVNELFDPGDGRWPDWAEQTFLAREHAEQVSAVRVVAEGPKDVRDAVRAAYALGGWETVRDFVEPLLREAQGELAGGTDRSEEKK